MMRIYQAIAKSTLALSTALSCYFLAMQEYQTAIVVFALWPLSRSLLAIADVFFTFFTERPLFAVEQPLGAESSRQNLSGH